MVAKACFPDLGAGVPVKGIQIAVLSGEVDPVGIRRPHRLRSRTRRSLTRGWIRFVC